MLRIGAIASLVVVLLAIASIHVQQRILRNRAERLIADVQRIRLYESDWHEAQGLMERWGRWGRYEGKCSPDDCVYEIKLEDGVWKWLYSVSPKTAERLLELGFLRVHSFMGGRYAGVQVQFLVQDGHIWRTSAAVAIEVPPRRLFHDPEGDPEDGGYFVMIRTRATQSLARSLSGEWILGSDEELALHPYYKAGKPGGCTNCYLAVVTYSTRTPQPEITRLTSFDLSCITRFTPCKKLEDVLPAARDWHLYDGVTPDYMQAERPEPCKAPVWVRSRDSSVVVVVQALGDSKEGEPDHQSLAAKVRVVEVLKGTSAWTVGMTANAYTANGEARFRPFQRSEPLREGKRYIVFPQPAGDDSVSEMYMFHCGVIEDSPEVRNGVKHGLSQNDELRGPELSFRSFQWN
jgi:hypothetical protein